MSKGKPTEPPTAASLLAERLVERLSALPLRLVNRSDYDLAIEAFERAVNFYFADYADKHSNDPLQFQLKHWNPEADAAEEREQQEVNAIYGRAVIPLRACMNTLSDLASIMLGRRRFGFEHQKEPFTEEELRRKAYQLTHVAEQEQRRPFEGNDVY